jgi:hypothetical protein
LRPFAESATAGAGWLCGVSRRVSACAAASAGGAGWSFGDLLSRRCDVGEGGPDGEGLALLAADGADGAVGGGLYLEGGLVRVYLEDRVALLYLGALLDQPAQDGGLLHVHP